MPLLPQSRRMLRWVTVLAAIVLVGPTVFDYLNPHSRLAQDAFVSDFPVRYCIGLQKTASRDSRRYALLSIVPPAAALAELTTDAPSRRIGLGALGHSAVLILFFATASAMLVWSDRHVKRLLTQRPNQAMERTADRRTLDS